MKIVRVDAKALALLRAAELPYEEVHAEMVWKTNGKGNGHTKKPTPRAAPVEKEQAAKMVLRGDQHPMRLKSASTLICLGKKPEQYDGKRGAWAYRHLAAELASKKTTRMSRLDVNTLLNTAREIEQGEAFDNVSCVVSQAIQDGYFQNAD